MFSLFFDYVPRREDLIQMVEFMSKKIFFELYNQIT